ncbi:MAG: nucleotidyltransferase family protein [Pseudomonadota bacterium]|jgi:predicted nucleotidyltransferase
MAVASLAEVLGVLRARRADIREKYLVDLIGVVGSFARGEAREDSDVDVWAESLRGTTLFKLGGALAELEEALGRRVDLIDRDTVKPLIRPSMERDLVRA